MTHLLVILMLAISAQADVGQPKRDLDSEWQKKEWLNRVARVLRYGRGLNAQDNLPALLKMSKEQAVAHFMQDSRFGDAVLDFNLYFFGTRESNLKDINGRYLDKVFDMPSAITSAKEVLKNGNYLRLLDYKQPLYLTTTGRLFPSPDKTKTDQEYRDLRKAEWLKQVNLALSLAEEGLEKNREKFCKAIYPEADSVLIASLYIGLPVNIYSLMRSAKDAWGSFYLSCVFPEVPFPADTLQRVRNFAALAPEYLAFIESLDPKKYNPQSVGELKEFDHQKFGMGDESIQLSRNMYVTLTNSSTNFNRRRAAFVLKRYFCDDLTPINIVPDEGGKGRHGSEASCMACHYKLDPMAGFFREKGLGGYDFSYVDTIRFDDNVIRPRSEYEKDWLSSNPARKWNIGYIRSNEFDSRNSYGEDLEDLFEIIRTAPEVKKCIVKRASQYILGEEQILDAGYLDHLTKNFNKDSESNSAMAFKNLWAKLLTSETFAHNDPLENECYDYAPGESPVGKAPCRVTFTLEQNCTQCHNANSGQGGLDLSRWVKMDSGEMNFPHLGPDGKQRSSKETLNAILFRLTSPDPDLRMPLNKFMTSADREELVLWAEKTIGGLKK